MVISVIIFLIGLGLGISIPLSTNPQQWYLGVIGIVASSIGAVFNGLHFWKLQSKEIKLEFGKITKDNNNGHFIRVQQKDRKVKGKAINVESRLTLENTNYEHAPSVWADEKKKIVNIGEHEDLFLFQLVNNTIILPSACEKTDFKPNPFNYNDVSERNLIIKISFENGNAPKDEVIPIKKIDNSVSL